MKHNFFHNLCTSLKMTSEGHSTEPFPLFTDFSLLPMPQLKAYSAHVHMHVHIEISMCICSANFSAMCWITTNMCMGNHHISSAIVEPELQATSSQGYWPGELTFDGVGLLSCGPHTPVVQPTSEDLLTPFQSICMGFLPQGSDWDTDRPRGQKCSWGPTINMDYGGQHKLLQNKMYVMTA